MAFSFSIKKHWMLKQIKQETKKGEYFYTLSLSIRVWTSVSSTELTGSDSFSTSSASSALLIRVFNCSLKPSQARDSDYKKKQTQGKHACKRQTVRLLTGFYPSPFSRLLSYLQYFLLPVKGVLQRC